MPTANTHIFSFLFTSLALYCVSLCSTWWAIMDLGYPVTFYNPIKQQNPLIISASTSNISLTYSVINIFHSESLSEPIRFVRRPESIGGRYLVSGVRPVNSNQPPNPLPVLINADNLSFKYPNQWSMARSTCRQLLPVTNWRKWFMSDWVRGGGC